MTARRAAGATTPKQRVRPARRPEVGLLTEDRGYVMTRLLGPEGLAALAAEAFERARFAGTSVVDTLSPDGEGPGIHCLETAEGGPVLAAFRAGDATLRALERLTGCRWQPLREEGSGHYTYYRQPFHFNGLHRDVGACEISVVTCIHDEPGAGGDLILFPGRAHESLTAIRADPEGGVVMRLEPGESLVIFGRLVPHCVTPVGPGRTRIVTAFCYRSIPPAAAP